MSPFRKIVVCLTETSDARPAFEQALTLAAAGNVGVTLLDVGSPIPEEARSSMPKATLVALERAPHDERVAILSSLAAEAQNRGVVVSTATASGSAFLIAIRAVLRDGSDLVLKSIDSSDERSKSPLGSTDKHLLRKCPCALWLVTADSEQQRGHVLAAVNPDPAQPEDNGLSVDILHAATAVATLDGRELHVLHAWRVFGELLLRGPTPVVSDPEVDHIVGRTLNRHATYLHDLLERLPTSVTAKPHLVQSRPADAIIHFVQSLSPSLLVMGTIGRTGIPGLLIGNTAERVLSEASCSVLALKPRGFVSPITRDG